MCLTKKMFKIQGGAQNYAWGRPGISSWVTIFLPSFREDLPYAEYWLGTHPSLPSSTSSGPLASLTGSLPYLFKLLSIAKPLSIQLHPSKPQAELLHSREPSLYPDANHKPEMCIAKDKMRLFIGFKTPEEIRLTLQSTPELLGIVGEGDLRSQLRRLFENEGETRIAVENYCKRVGEGVYFEVNQHFPNDPGVFFAMLMNYVELSPGQAMVIDAGVPHCYIEGECIEAMACSDNVVRAGLTPKAKDVGTLLQVRNMKILNYDAGKPHIFEGDENRGRKIYSSGYQEFNVDKYFGSGRIVVETKGPMLGFVTSGVGRVGEEEIRRGNCVAFLGDTEVQAEEFEMYSCYAN
jgi:mannose-6-phosphate isomerase